MAEPNTTPPAEPQQVTHDEMVAAAMAELIEEAREDPDGNDNPATPPDWFRKVFENT